MAAPTWATARFIDARNSGPARVGEHQQPDRALGGTGLDGRGIGLARCPRRSRRAGLGRSAVAPDRPPRLRATTNAPTATAARRLRHAAAGTGSKAVRANEVATYADPNPIAASAANNSPR